MNKLNFFFLLLTVLLFLPYALLRTVILRTVAKLDGITDIWDSTDDDK